MFHMVPSSQVLVYMSPSIEPARMEKSEVRLVKSPRASLMSSLGDQRWVGSGSALLLPASRGSF